MNSRKPQNLLVIGMLTGTLLGAAAATALSYFQSIFPRGIGIGIGIGFLTGTALGLLLDRPSNGERKSSPPTNNGFRKTPVVEPWFSRLVVVLSTVHFILALNFFPLVPFLGWLNLGRGEWIAWIPDVILLQLLPAGYALYWHYWYLIALPAVVGSWLLCYRTQGKRGCWLLPANLTGAGIYVVVRLTLIFLEIHPDIVWTTFSRYLLSV